MNNTEIDQKPSNKNDLFTMTLLTIGTMVGAGILIIPGLVIGYGFAGIIGWIISAFCALALSSIFALNAVSSDKVQTLGKSANAVFGPSVAFKISMIQCLYLILAVAFVTKTMVLYLSNFIFIGKDWTSETSAAIIALTAMMSIIINFSAAYISVFATFVKLGFFSLTSIIGLFTLKRAKFFGIQGVSKLAQRCHLEFIVLMISLILTTSAVVFLRGKKLRTSVISIITLLCIFMIYNNFDLLIKAIYANDKTLSCVAFKAIKAASATMFAFAGLEFAAADPDSAINPKVNIPRSSTISIIVASIVFIATHLCCVNNLDVAKDDISKPVQTALVHFANDIMRYLHLGADIKYIASKMIEKIISIIAIIGCLGTCLAVMLCASNIFYDAVKEVLPDANRLMPQNSLKVRPIAILIICLMITICVSALYYIKPLLGAILDFCILHTYFYVVLIALKNGVDLSLALTGIGGCMLLASGCDAKGVFLVALICFIIDAFFICISLHENQSEKTSKRDNRIDP